MRRYARKSHELGGAKTFLAIDDAGGIITMDDLKSYQPVIRAPVRGSYRGYDIVSMPLPSSGGFPLRPPCLPSSTKRSPT